MVAIGIAVPNAPADRPSGDGSRLASERYVAGAPAEVPATRTSITSRSDGSPSAAESRFRTAASVSRGTTGPLEVITGSRDASPARTRKTNPSWTGLGSASRHRTSRTPGIVRGNVAGSECSVYIAGCVPIGSGNAQSITPDPASTSRSSPSSNTTAGRVNSSRMVSAEYGTPNAPPPSDRSTAPSTRSIDRTEPSSSRSAPRRARTFVMPGAEPIPITADRPASRNRGSSSHCLRVTWYRPPRSA